MVAPDIMTPVIDKAKTGRQIKAMMKMRHVTVEDVRAGLSLGCVQSVYHWRRAFAALLQAFAGLYGGLKESDHIIQSNPRYIAEFHAGVLPVKWTMNNNKF